MQEFLIKNLHCINSKLNCLKEENLWLAIFLMVYFELSSSEKLDLIKRSLSLMKFAFICYKNYFKKFIYDIHEFIIFKI